MNAAQQSILNIKPKHANVWTAVNHAKKINFKFFLKLNIINLRGVNIPSLLKPLYSRANNHQQP